MWNHGNKLWVRELKAVFFAEFLTKLPFCVKCIKMTLHRSWAKSESFCSFEFKICSNCAGSKNRGHSVPWLFFHRASLVGFLLFLLPHFVCSASLPQSTFADYKAEKPMRCIVGDIRSKQEVQESLQGVGTVFHTAALISFGTHPDLAGMEEVNVRGKNPFFLSRALAKQSPLWIWVTLPSSLSSLCWTPPDPLSTLISFCWSSWSWVPDFRTWETTLMTETYMSIRWQVLLCLAHGGFFEQNFGWIFRGDGHGICRLIRWPRVTPPFCWLRIFREHTGKRETRGGFISLCVTRDETCTPWMHD